MDRHTTVLFEVARELWLLSKIRLFFLLTRLQASKATGFPRHNYTVDLIHLHTCTAHCPAGQRATMPFNDFGDGAD